MHVLPMAAKLMHLEDNDSRFLQQLSNALHAACMLMHELAFIVLAKPVYAEMQQIFQAGWTISDANSLHLALPCWHIIAGRQGCQKLSLKGCTQSWDHTFNVDQKV